MKSVIQLLRQNPSYALFCLSQLISAIGSGLTQVAVYGSLARMGVSPIWYTAAFAIALLPSLLASKLGETLFARYEPGKLLLSSNIFSLLLLLPAILAGERPPISLLILAEFVGAMSVAFAYPIQQTLIKRLFKGEELIACLKLDTALFSSQVVIGVGVGTLLFDHFGSRNYLTLDALTYLLAGLAILVLASHLPLSAIDCKQGESLSSQQVDLTAPARKQAFYALPLLALCTTPAISLLPSIGTQFSASISPALLFLFAKCIGQVIGPFCTPSSIYRSSGLQFQQHFWLVIAGFAAIYCTLPHSPLLWVAFVTILAAHILSNVAYTVSIYQLQSTFKETEIASVSAQVYRLQLTLMVLTSLITGALSQWMRIEFCIALPLLVVGAHRILSHVIFFSKEVIKNESRI